MFDSSPSIRRLCIAAVAEGGTHHVRNRADTWSRAGLVKVLHGACARAGMDRVYWDGAALPPAELALLQPGVDEPRIMAAFLHEVRAVLDEVNRNTGDGGRQIRLRLAFHQGITSVADDRFTGQAVTTIGQLIDSPSVDDALAQHPSADLAVIVSDALFCDVSGHWSWRRYADEFAPPVAAQSDQAGPPAWIHVSDSNPSGPT